MAKYKLTSRYWDGSAMHRVGSVLDFPEGAAPKGSVLQEEQPKAEPTKAKAEVKKD